MYIAYICNAIQRREGIEKERGRSGGGGGGCDIGDPLLALNSRVSYSYTALK